MVELHPLARTLDDLDAHPELRVVGPYFPAHRPQRLRIHGSYAEPDAPIEHNVAYGWTHSFAEILNALIGAGLRLEYLHEFPCSVVPFSRSMKRARRRLVLPARRPPRRALPVLAQGEPRRRRRRAAAMNGAPGPSREQRAAQPGASGARPAAQPDPSPDQRAANRELWDELTAIHERSAFYDVEGFLAGALSLTARSSSTSSGERARQAPAAPAVPLRPRHAVVGAPRRDRHRRRLLGQGDRAGAPPGGAEPACRRPSSSPTSTSCRESSTSASTSSSPRGARSAGCPTSQRWARLDSRPPLPRRRLLHAEFHPFLFALADECEQPLLRARLLFSRRGGRTPGQTTVAAATPTPRRPWRRRSSTSGTTRSARSSRP